jgi:hypothetical protein
LSIRSKPHAHRGVLRLDGYTTPRIGVERVGFRLAQSQATNYRDWKNCRR